MGEQTEGTTAPRRGPERATLSIATARATCLPDVPPMSSDPSGVPRPTVPFEPHLGTA